MPPAYRGVDASEPSVSQTECLLEGPDDAGVTVIARFLHLQRRQVEVEDGAGGFRPVASVQVDDADVTTWDEAAEREHRATVPLAALLAGGVDSAFAGAGRRERRDAHRQRAGALAGRLVRRQAPLTAVIRLRAERLPGPYGALRLRLTIENRTSPDGPLRRREDGLRLALIAAHCADPRARRQVPVADRPSRMGGRRTPRRASTSATWPVLAGPEECRELVLCSPVILYDHPRIAAESAGDLFDSTEIDEILTLRTLAADRRGEAGGPRHRPARGRAAGPPGRPAAGDARAHARRHPLSRPGRRRTGTGPPGDGVPVTGRAAKRGSRRPPRRIVRCPGGIRARTPASPRRATTS